jgi:hypothetical protein
LSISLLKEEYRSSSCKCETAPATPIPIPIFAPLFKPPEEFVSGVLLAEDVVVTPSAVEVASEEADTLGVADEVEEDVLREAPRVAAIEIPLF